MTALLKTGIVTTRMMHGGTRELIRSYTRSHLEVACLMSVAGVE